MNTRNGYSVKLNRSVTKMRTMLTPVFMKMLVLPLSRLLTSQAGGKSILGPLRRKNMQLYPHLIMSRSMKLRRLEVRSLDPTCHNSLYRYHRFPYPSEGTILIEYVTMPTLPFLYSPSYLSDSSNSPPDLALVPFPSAAIASMEGWQKTIPAARKKENR